MISTVRQGATVKATTYQWLSDGTKVQVEYSNGDGYVFLGSFLYYKSGSIYRFDSAGFSGGRMIAGVSAVTPNYQITDHLGSVRVMFADKRRVLAQNDYYAFGKSHANPDLRKASDNSNRYLFNGKERQTTGSVGFLDYGARMFDDEWVRWWSMDPMGEKRFFSSPYSYCLGNPVNNIDLYGLIDWRAVGEGTLQTLGGGLMMAGGAVYSGGTAGIGAVAGGGALIIGGVSVASFGIAKIVGGLTSDGSEKSIKALKSLPTSLPDVAGIVIDEVMGNENSEARNVIKVVEGVAGVATGDVKSVGGLISTVMSGGQILDGATGLLIPSSDSSTTSNPSSGSSTPNFSTNSSISASFNHNQPKVQVTNYVEIVKKPNDDR